jgi:TonB family protein
VEQEGKDSLKNSLTRNHRELNHRGGKTSGRYRRYFFLATILSLIFHSGLLVLFLHLWQRPPANRKQRAIQVFLYEPNRFSAKPEPTQNKTVVQLVVEQNPIKPKNAKYLADQDSTVVKETKAKLRGQNASSPKALPKNNLKKAEVNEKHPQALTPDDVLAVKKLPKSDPLNLKPNFSDEKIKFGHGSIDHLPGVDEGDETKLNAWQWRHAPFFHRVKSRIGDIWSPQKQIARYDPQGALLGNKDRVTTLIVTIDHEGFLKNLLVAETSGVQYLDEEAVRAVREAAPFSFPPHELFNKYGEFSFRFGFYLQVNQGFSFDFDW